MTDQKIHGLAEAQRLTENYKTPRSRTLEFYRSVYDGTRYAGRPAWFDDTDKPVWDRAPCVKYLAVKSAIASNVDLLLGENRYPQVTARTQEDDSEEGGLSEKESETVDRFLLACKEEAELEPLLRELYESAQIVGSCAAIVGVRNYQVFADAIDTKYATVTRGANREIVSVEISYPYIEHRRTNEGWRAYAMLYRRVIDALSDTTYKPGPCRDDGKEPVWSPEPSMTVQHDLGFVPVVWHKHNVPRMSCGTEDGEPIHKYITDELAAVDTALSMRHEGALYCRPERVEIGVTPGYNPTGNAPAAASAYGSKDGGSFVGGDPFDTVNNPAGSAATSRYLKGGSGASGKRRRGPGWVSQFENPETKVTSIDTPGDALTALDNNIRDIRLKICETLAWVPLDPDSVKFAATVSGKALEVLRERQLNRISSDRQTFGKGVISAVYQMILRVVAKVGASVGTQGAQQAMPVIMSMTSGAAWQPPRLSLNWPPYFLPSAEDTQKTVDTTSKAYDAGFITKKTAVEKLARSFAIENVDLYLEALEEEAEKREEKANKEERRATAKLHAAGLKDLDDSDESSDESREDGESEESATG